MTGIWWNAIWVFAVTELHPWKYSQSSKNGTVTNNDGDILKQQQNGVVYVIDKNWESKTELNQFMNLVETVCFRCILYIYVFVSTYIDVLRMTVIEECFSRNCMNATNRKWVPNHLPNKGILLW